MVLPSYVTLDSLSTIACRYFGYFAAGFDLLPSPFQTKGETPQIKFCGVSPGP